MSNDNNKTEKKDPNYRQLFAPDVVRLSVLLEAAKGPDRTMAEFVDVCKGKGNVPSVSTPTFSRIKRRMLSRPVSDELLKVIAEHSDNPEIANYDSLMRANGKVPNEEYAQNQALQNVGFNGNRSKHAAICEFIEGIVVYDLIQKACVVSKINLEMAKTLRPDTYEELIDEADWTLRIQGEEPLFWNFILADAYITWMSVKEYDKLGGFSFKDRRSLSFNVDENSGIIKSAAENFNIKLFCQDYYPLFLRDAWKPEIMKDAKTTFVFISKASYNKAKEFLSEARFNSIVSLMLVDIEQRKVVKEERI